MPEVSKFLARGNFQVCVLKHSRFLSGHVFSSKFKVGWLPVGLLLPVWKRDAIICRFFFFFKAACLAFAACLENWQK